MPDNELEIRFQGRLIIFLIEKNETDYSFGVQVTAGIGIFYKKLSAFSL